jgi:hypothetical protein
MLDPSAWRLIQQWQDRVAHRQRQGQAQQQRSTAKLEGEDVKVVALQAMENIVKRLSGKLPPKVDIVISPADQVAALISEASNPINLVGTGSLVMPRR